MGMGFRRGRPTPYEEVVVEHGDHLARVTALPLSSERSRYRLTVMLSVPRQNGLSTAVASAVGALDRRGSQWAAEVAGARSRHRGGLDDALRAIATDYATTLTRED